MSPGELAAWLGMAVAAGLAATLSAALVASLLPWRRTGFVAAALLALHAGTAYRFEVAINLFARDPRVWGGMLAIGLASLAVGLALDRLVDRRLPWIVALGVAAAGVGVVRGWHPVPGGGADDRLPDILLVSLDTTRADQLSVYGGPAPTPTLERLAAEGVRFDQAIAAAPLTEPSHLALVTGRTTAGTGLVTNGTDIGDRPEMIQRRLAALGYRSAAFVSGFPLHGKFGWTQGFDVYDDDFGAVPGLHRLSLVRLWDDLVLPAHALRERPGARTVRRVLSWFRRDPAGPLFTWVHFFDPHAPYEVSDEELAAAPRDGEPLDLPAYWPPPYRSITSTEWLVRSYHQELARVDGYLGRIIEVLESLDRLDRTIVVVVADHGESLTEHDYLFDHGDHLWDPELRIPFIVRAPGMARAGTVVDCQVRIYDVVPTLLDLLRLPAGEVDGVSLVPAMRGEGCRDQPAISSAVGARFVDDPPIDWALRNPRSKYIRYGKGGESYYDLVADPGETRDLAPSGPPGLATSRLLLDRLLEGAAEVALPEQDAATQDALRALGYVE